MGNPSESKSLSVKAKSDTPERDETFQLISWWKKELVRDAKVMVVGAGALGNEVLKNLALLNVGHIFIVDFDEIEYSNLSRSVLFRESDCNRKKCEVAAERIREINPNVKVQALDGDVTSEVGLGVFRAMDVVVGCLDNRLARLFLNRACHKVNKTWIDGGIQDLAGQAHVFKPGRTCYECTLSKKDWAYIDFRLSCPDIAYFHSSQGRIATTPIAASIIGAIQAQEALKVIKGDERFQMLDDFFYYEGRTNTVLQRRYPPLKDFCQSHYEYEPITESPLSSQMTLKEALAWLSEYFHDEQPQILLDGQLVLEITTQQSEIMHEVILPKSRLQGAFVTQFQRIPGEVLVLSKSVQELDSHFPHQDLSLADCGIPALHIIRVLTDDGEKYVELSADKTFIHFS
jgi:molybdopterin/thiamine biosynthesis adenylyltransferase